MIFIHKPRPQPARKTGFHLTRASMGGSRSATGVLGKHVGIGQFYSCTGMTTACREHHSIVCMQVQHLCVPPHCEEGGHKKALFMLLHNASFNWLHAQNKLMTPSASFNWLHAQCKLLDKSASFNWLHGQYILMDKSASFRQDPLYKGHVNTDRIRKHRVLTSDRSLECLPHPSKGNFEVGSYEVDSFCRADSADTHLAKVQWQFQIRTMYIS